MGKCKNLDWNREKLDQEMDNLGVELEFEDSFGSEKGLIGKMRGLVRKSRVCFGKVMAFWNVKFIELFFGTKKENWQTMMTLI